MPIFNKILGILKNIFSRSDWARTVRFDLIDIGPIVREKYVDLHAFGDQVLYQDDLPDGIKYIGPKDNEKFIEIVYEKDTLGLEEIRLFLKKYKIEIGEIEDPRST